MAEKDAVEKTLESYNDVFADIVNGLLFKGEQVIKENELEAESETSMYKADGKLHEQERDVAKYWKNGKVRIALYGIENQTTVDPDMPLRVLNYDGAAYRNQLNQKRKALRYPVITLVLYFGEGNWNKSKNLLDCLEIPEKLRPFVNDYKINLFEICKLTEDQISYFKSDFRIIVDYFVKKKKNPDYQGNNETIKYVDEFFKLMKALTNDNRFETMYNENISKKQGGSKMDKFLDLVEERGAKKGKAEIIQNLIKSGKITVKQIADMMKLPVEEIQELADMTLVHAS